MHGVASRTYDFAKADAETGRFPFCFVANREGLLVPKKMQWPILKVSNFEQTIALSVCCFAQHRGIALSGHRKATPTGIIGPGGVVPMRVSYFFTK
jgi:hypothetical protein